MIFGGSQRAQTADGHGVRIERQTPWKGVCISSVQPDVVSGPCSGSINTSAGHTQMTCSQGIGTLCSTGAYGGSEIPRFSCHFPRYRGYISCRAIRRGLFATLTCGGCEAPARPARPAASPERYVRRGGLGGSESSTKRAWGAAQVCLPNATALCVRQLWTAAAGVGGMGAA